MDFKAIDNRRKERVSRVVGRGTFGTFLSKNFPGKEAEKWSENWKHAWAYGQEQVSGGGGDAVTP